MKKNDLFLPCGTLSIYCGLTVMIKNTLLRTALIWTLLFPFLLQAQGYIDCATVLTDESDFGLNSGPKVQVRDGYTYMAFSAGYTGGGILPPIIGSGLSYGGSINTYIAVFDENCNQIVGTFTGGVEQDDFYDLVVNDDGSFFVFGSTEDPDFPTTDGTSAGSLFVQKYALDGTLLYSTVLGGVTSFGGLAEIKKDGDDIYLVGEITSGDVFQTTTDGTNGGGGSTNVFAAKLDGSGNLVYASMIGGADREEDPIATVVNGCLYLLARTQSTDFPTTDGTIADPFEPYLIKYDPLGNVVFSTVMKGGGSSPPEGIVADASGVYIAFPVSSGNTDFVTTDGSSLSSARPVGIRKYDNTGNLVYSKLLNGTGIILPSLEKMVLKDGKLYLAIEGEGFPTTDGSTGGENVVKLDAATGNIEYAVAPGNNTRFSNIDDIVVNDAGEVFLVMRTTVGTMTTDGSAFDRGMGFVKLNADGSTCAFSVIPAQAFGNDTDLCTEVDGNTIWAVYRTDNTFPPPRLNHRWFLSFTYWG